MNDYLEMTRESSWEESQNVVRDKDSSGRAKDALPGKSLVWVNHKSLDKLGSVSSKMSSYIIWICGLEAALQMATQTKHFDGQFMYQPKNSVPTKEYPS